MKQITKVIFFDAGGTLFRPYPSVGAVYAQTAAKHGAQDRLSTINRVTFVMPLPKRYFQEFTGERGKIEGVTHATYANWFGGKHATRETEFFANFAVDTDSYFDVYQDMAVPPDQLAAWKEDRQGAVIGEALAKQFDWNVGDDVTLIGTIYPGEWKFHIRGIYVATNLAYLYVNSIDAVGAASDISLSLT